MFKTHKTISNLNKTLVFVRTTIVYYLWLIMALKKKTDMTKQKS